MKIFNAEQIKKCDSVTCENQNIQIRELINRAGNSFVEMLTATDADLSGKIFVICGYGNNGADGIAIAKLLYARYCDIELLLIPAESKKLNSEYMQFYLDNPVDSQPFPV
ncbi:MAG TPA: NAD(P)H-hydrate epimerase, partial [Saprospiraceae bacterium]|nr:NAD(P)H-hydrate epimerase [Saprospiraceae bacterium]